jgi:hypothetical protein
MQKQSACRSGRRFFFCPLYGKSMTPGIVVSVVKGKVVLAQMICLPQEQRILQYLLNFLWKFGTKPISDSLSQIEGRSGIVKIFEKDAKISEKIVRCKVSGKQLRFQTTLQTIFPKLKGELS